MAERTPESSICDHLRSKRYFFLDRAPQSAADLLDGSNDCWCERTMQKIGPDHDLVHPEDCTAARACFRSSARPLPT